MKTNKDLVDRQAAIDALDRIGSLDTEADKKYARSVFEALPSVQSEITNEEIRFALKQLGAYFSIKIRDKKESDVPVELLQRVEEIQEYVDNLPSVQPQITHCAECIHWKHSDMRKNYCEVFDWMNKAEDFCSFAERRTDETD